MKRLYIAYGSNLHLEQMRYRCPTARVYKKGVIEDYTLVFRGSKTGAYATVIPKKGDKVPVVVWEIQPNDEKNLDRYEGFPTFYYKKDLWVKTEDGYYIEGMAYIMFDQAKPGRPTMTYLETCTQGYLDNKLDMRLFEQFMVNNRIECTYGRTRSPFLSF